MNTAFETVIDVLRARVSHGDDSPGYLFLCDGEAESESLTYRAIDQRSRRIAAELQQQVAPGARVLLLYPPGLDFIPAFFGCMAAGVIAVPTYAPHPLRPARCLPLLEPIAREADISAILCTAALAERTMLLFREIPALAGAPILATDREGPDATCAGHEPSLDRSTIAFLQYTSGSTAAPKGVMVTHGNLLHNLACIRSGADLGSDNAGVSWLPVHHDMGLLGGVLFPLFMGYRSHLMSPVPFVQKPIRWLAAISRFRATVSGGPNFAYDLCIQKTTAQQREGLDLRCWQLAYNGAEPVRQTTLDTFAHTFRSCGFRRRSFRPVYGLAESTVLVSGGRLDDDAATGHDALCDRADKASASTDGANRHVSCGRPAADVQVRIVDPERRAALAEGVVGEIWVSSPSVARGYWNRPAETAHTFGGFLDDDRTGPFLRTGDLGVIRDGELFVTGRIKDLIIIRGRKHYPQDIEHVAGSSHPVLEPGSTASFSLSTGDGEKLVIVAELATRRRRETSDWEPDDVVGAIRQAVAEQHELQTHAVVIVPPGGLPRTPNGKLQRHACRQRFLDGSFELLACWPCLPVNTGASHDREMAAR